MPPTTFSRLRDWFVIAVVIACGIAFVRDTSIAINAGILRNEIRYRASKRRLADLVTVILEQATLG